MLLRENFEHAGQWLFRWRSFLPLAAVAVLPAALGNYEHPFGDPNFDMLWEFTCFGVSVAGLLVRIKTVGHAPRNTSGRNTKRQVADHLNTTGMYSLLRNPLYLGNFLIALGVAIHPRVWWLPVLMLLCFIIYYERIVFAEEQFLQAKFGRQYADWAARNPAFLPRLRNWTPPALPFSWRTVVKREYQTFCGIIAAFCLLELVENIELYGRLELDRAWLAAAVVGLLIFVIVRLIRKKTVWLRVPGR
jgi:protein-S-isoprenylcysteine O-methyltransferase Ste14